MGFKVDTTTKEVVKKRLTREDIINPFKDEFELAPAQEDIILAVQDNDTIIVDSIAGSAKTSSQVAIAHNYHEDSLYLTFSKALATEAEHMFPDHVECRTIHSLAYRETGVDIAHKLCRPRGKYKNVAGTGSEIAKYYKIDHFEVDDRYEIKNTLIGLIVKQTLAKYEASDDQVIGKEHLPYALLKLTKNKYKHIDNKKLTTIFNKLNKMVIKYSNLLWKDRQDSKSPVLASHDTYVKMWALTNPTIRCKLLFLDEIQDASMVFMGVVKNQIGKCKIILVGDPDQNLYSWRYSVNGLDLVEGKKMDLDQSFRYGQRTADLAMLILDNGRNMKGMPSMDTVVGSHSIVDRNKHYTKLFRLNSTLLQEALSLIGEGLKVNIHVDVQDYVKMLESAEALYLGRMNKVKHEDILPFDTWQELKDEAKTGGVLARVYNTINKGNTHKTVSYLQAHKNVQDPDVTLMTCHRSKGMTLDYVILADDFESNFNQHGEWVGMDDAEKRLLYVGATRAKYGLEYNRTVQEIIERQEAKEEVKTYSKNKVQVIGTPKGEQAGYALQDVVQIESLRNAFANHTMSDEDAFEYGFLDPSGVTTDIADFKEERILPFTEHSLDSLLGASMFGINNKDIHQLERFLDYNTTVQGSFAEGVPCYDNKGNLDWRFKG